MTDDAPDGALGNKADNGDDAVIPAGSNAGKGEEDAEAAAARDNDVVDNDVDKPVPPGYRDTFAGTTDDDHRGVIAAGGDDDAAVMPLERLIGDNTLVVDG